MIDLSFLRENCYPPSSQLMAQDNDTPTAQMYCQQGASLQQQGQFKQAIQCYQEAIALDPDGNADVYCNLGCLLVAEAQLDEAVLIFQTALTRFSREDSHLYNNLAYSYFKQGNLDQAIANYLRAIQLQPDLVQAHYNLGKAFQQQGYHQVALSYFERVLALQPDFTEVHGNCVSSLIEQKQFEQALYHCQMVIIQKLPWITAYCQGVGVRRDPNLPALPAMDQAKIACCQFLQRLQTETTDLTLAYRFLAQTYLYIGDSQAEYRNFAQAELYYQKANQIDPKWFESYCRLGDCAVESHSWVKATRYYSQALKLDPQNPILHERLEKVLDKQQQIERGEIISDRRLIGSDLRLPLDLTPKTASKTACQGLDCLPCLKQIARQLEPVKYGEGIYYFPPSSQPLPWIIPEPTVTIIPQGGAWIAPKKNWWNVCNAIAILNQQGELLTEFSCFYPTPLPNCQHYDWSQHQIFSLKELPPVKKLEGRVVVLSGLSGNVYFHWMVDILPRLEILKQHDIDLESIDWFVVNACETAFQRETLKKLGIPETKIIESDRSSYLQASHLIVPSFPAPVGWVVPWVMDFWRKVYAAEQATSASGKQQRIYISRRGARYRQVLNEPDVMALLGEWGFVCVELEQLSVSEQVRLFAQAEIIVAPHGAGLTNLMFCQPQTCVIELISPNYVRHYYWLMSHYLNLKHYTLEGEILDCAFLRQLMYPSPLIEDIWINLQSLAKVLELSGIIKDKGLSDNSSDPKADMLFYVSEENTLEEWLELAKSAFAQKQVEAGIQACESALKLDANCAEAYGILGNIYQIQGRWEPAKDLYEKAIQLQPTYAEAYGNLGSLYAKQQQWELAVQYYQTTLQYKPNADLIYRNLAKVWTKLNRPGEAAECWYHSYRLQPDQARAQEYLELGNVLLEQGKIEFAIACFRHALNQDPNLAAAQTALEQAQSEEDKMLEMCQIKPPQLFQPSAIINETELLQQAEENFKKKALKQAITQCQQVIAQSPNQAKAYEILGKTLHQLGRFDLAMRAYRKLVKLSPQDAIAHTNLGNLYAKQRQWQSAVLAYQRAIAINPNLAVAYRNLAQVLDRIGKQDIAIQYWYQGFSLKPEAVKPTEHLALGSLLLRRGKLVDAATCYRRALWFDPTCAEAHHNLGEVLATQGQWDEAIAHYQQALKINPHAFETYNSLGKAFVIQGRWQEVLTCYHQALELNPRLLMAWQNLTQALIHSSQSLQGSGNSHEILQMLAGTFLSGQARLGTSLPRRELPGSGIGETWTTTAVSMGEPLAESSQYQQAQARFEQGNYLDCIRDCEQLTVAYPQEVTVYWLLGKAWAALGNGEKAKQCYKQGIKLQPQEGEGYVRIGELYAQEGNWKLAIACYQKAIQFQPSALTYRQLSQGWQVLGNWENVEDCLYEALRLEPEQVSVQDCLQLGDALWEREQRTQAMICYGQALVRDPHFAIRHPHLGERLQEPESEKQKTLQLSSGNPLISIYNGNGNGKHSLTQKNQGELLEQAYQKLQLTQWEACIKICSQVIEQEPQQVEAYRLMAQALYNQGEIAPALAVYEQLRQLQPEDPEIYATLGDIYAEQEQWDAAIQSYQTAVQLNPQLTSVQEALGDIWSRQGQWQKASACYQQMLQVEPELWEVHHKLGDVLWQQGEVEAAVEAYQQAAELSKVP